MLKGILALPIFAVVLCGADDGSLRTNHALYRVTSDLVLVHATVTDRNGHPVEGLEADDFRVFDRKAEQRIEYFAREEAPASVLIVLDASGSMRHRLGAVGAAAYRLLDALDGTRDEVALVVFSEHPELVASWTDVDNARSALMHVKPAGRTALLDAVDFAIPQFKKARNRRHAMIVLSDGVDNYSRRRLNEVAGMLLEGDVELYALSAAIPMFEPQRELGTVREPDVLELLCDKAGGRYFEPDSDSELSHKAAAIADQLKLQYIIGYRPEPGARDGQYRSISVRLNGAASHAGLNVNSRHGYREPVD